MNLASDLYANLAIILALVLLVAYFFGTSIVLHITLKPKSPNPSKYEVHIGFFGIRIINQTKKGI